MVAGEARGGGAGGCVGGGKEGDGGGGDGAGGGGSGGADGHNIAPCSRTASIISLKPLSCSVERVLMRRYETRILPLSGTCSTRETWEEQFVVSGPAKRIVPGVDPSRPVVASMLVTNGALLISNISMCVANTGTSKPTTSHSSPIRVLSGVHVP